MEAAKGGEVRKLHIIYFLSHMGRIEQPHLIRVHHLTPYGVYLRDVKRWLADLRGKDMPEAFAWSYKWRYKGGYVWQDLLDDDLITPISDNEYVLKGSQISPTPLEPCLKGEKKGSILQEQKTSKVDEEIRQQQPLPEQQYSFQQGRDSKSDTPSKFSSDLSQESSQFSSERSTFADEFESAKAEQEDKYEQKEKLLGTEKQNKNGESNVKSENCSSSFYHSLLNKMNKKKNKNKNEDTDHYKNRLNSTSPSQPSLSRTKSIRMFCNFVTCGASDSNDSVVDWGNKSNPSKSNFKGEICRGDMFGGSTRVFGTTNYWNCNQQRQHHYYNARKSCDGGKRSNNDKKKQRKFMNQKAFSAVFKTIGGPSCSLCGKSFRPEKMHSHMKSCKGMKALAKKAGTSEKPVFKEPRASSCEETPAYLLINTL